MKEDQKKTNRNPKLKKEEDEFKKEEDIKVKK